MGMNEKISDEILRKENRKLKKRTGRILYGFLFLTFTCYSIFFTSMLWLPADYENIRVTQIGESITENSRKITLVSWTYAEHQALQEVIVEIQNASSDGIKKYQWTALDRKKGFFPVKVIEEKEDYAVLHIENVSSGWTEISLRMDAEEALQHKFQTVRMYASNREIERTDEIQPKTDRQYRIFIADRKIQLYEEALKAVFDEDISLDARILQAEERKNSLKEMLSYQTGEEKMETEKQILQLQTEIDAADARKESLKKEQDELEEKIRLQEKKKESL